MRNSDTDTGSGRGRRTGTKLLATALVLGLIGAVAGFGTWSAFSSTTANEGNSFAAGTVTISDDDSDSAMFDLDGLRPGEPGPSGAKCIQVTYGGSLAANVRLYGGTTSGTLGPYLDVKVTRGTIVTPSFPSCTGFTPDSTEYVSGQGNGVVYDGTLASFPSSYATGIEHPASTWSSGNAAVYHFEVTVQDDNDAQGKNASGVSFTWEARSS